MATGQWPTLLDVSSRYDPDGKPKVIAEMLSQSNEIWEDLPMKESSEIMGHDFAFRSSLPAGYWSSYNQGIPTGKSTTNKARVGLGRLQGYSQIDKNLARDSGNAENFRMSEDQAFFEGMSQTMTKAVIYGNSAVNPSEFMGLTGFYNTVNTSNQPNARNVISAGGLGTSNSSIWLVGWGDRQIHGLFPRGSQTGGLQHEDYSDSRAGYDNIGNMFEVYTSHFQQTMGLCPMDWRWGVRICNVDTTTAGLGGPNAPDLFTLMAEALHKCPTGSKESTGVTSTDAPGDPTPGVRQVFYVNRTIRRYLETQAIRDRNVLLSLDEYAGRTITKFRGIPVKTVDQILNTESTVV